MRSGDVQLDLFAGAKPLDAHVWRKEADGFYVEPEWCSERLFAAEQFAGSVWDPACGTGRVPEAGGALFADCHGQTWRYIERNT
jgi:hypothetical protein